MKKIILILLVAAFTKSNAQIVLENTYSNAFDNIFYGSVFRSINLGPSGIKYALIDSFQIQIYNTDHSLFRSFAIPQIVNSAPLSVLLITENLFDTDSTTIEYLVEPFDIYPATVRVFREDGTQLFSEDSASILVQMLVATSPTRPIWNPIVVTDNGVKMMLIKNDTEVNIYSLPGTLPNTCCNGNIFTGLEGFQPTDAGAFLKNYPNPSSNQTTIEYQLPDNISSCDLTVYDMSGREIKRYRVTNRFNNIKLDISEIPQGTYYYQLQTGDTNLAGKKMIIIR